MFSTDMLSCSLVHSNLSFPPSSLFQVVLSSVLFVSIASNKNVRDGADKSLVL
jgi:hypothetical protein